MKFQRGAPRPINSGRKKGSKNKRKVAKVADYLAEREINPAAEILRIIPSLDEKDQVSTWLDLLSYCQAKPKDEGIDTGALDPSEFEGVSNAELLQLIKTNETT